MSQFTPQDVASHNTADNGLYIIIDSNVYDVTNFIDEHPGGAKILKQFWKVGLFWAWFCLVLPGSGPGSKPECREKS